MRVKSASCLITLLFAALFSQSRSLAEESVRIGWTGPLSGNSAVLGIDSLQAVRIVIAKANEEGGIGGRRIELIAEDDQYDTAKAVTAYNKLVSEHVVAILASTYGGVFATANRAMSDDVVVINPLDCNNDIAALSENTFCIATESESIGRLLAEAVSKGQGEPLAVLMDGKNPFMVLVSRVIRERYPQARFFELDQSTSDFKTVLSRVRSLGVKSMVFLGHDPMGQAMREARALGISARFYTVGTITSRGFQKLAGSSADGTLVAYWTAPRGPALEQFLSEFQAKVGRPPILELASIPSADAAAILINALRSAAGDSGKISVSALREALYEVKDFQGLSGRISMDPDGAVRSIKESLFRYQNGNLTRVE